MSRKLYLECYSGISGDMTVAALTDLGVEESYLKQELEKLHLDGYEIRISRTKKNQITAADFDVLLAEDGETHSHDEAHAHHHHHHHHSHNSGSAPADVKEQEHGHEHGHSHSHSHNSYREICELISQSELNSNVKDMSLKIFRVIAEAEAKVHGMPVDQVHFHEVGAVDSIVDITAAAICMDKLGFDSIITSELWEGKGTTWCQHGRIPVPAPAVLEMMAEHRVPVKFAPVEGEMITPTGAGIVAALSEKGKLPNGFVIEKVGVGAGKKDFPHANILRAMILNTDADAAWNKKKETEPAEKQKDDADDKKPVQVTEERGANGQNTVSVLETNVDDCSGEQLGYAMECLLEAGALDTSCIPVYMKKNRPAYMLQVICRPEDEEKMETVIFRETTSIGLRKYREERSILPREMITVTLPGGHEVRVKKCSHHGQEFYYPEYEDVRAVCKETNHSFSGICREAAESADKKKMGC